MGARSCHLRFMLAAKSFSTFITVCLVLCLQIHADCKFDTRRAILYCTSPYIAIHSHDVSMSIITAIISFNMYDIYMIYQPFEQLESLYLECKLITSKNFIGTYFGHMVTISDIGAGPQSRPLPLVLLIFQVIFY